MTSTGTTRAAARRSLRRGAVLLPLLAAGCATPLHHAREAFYRGRLAEASAAVDSVPAGGKDEVLVLLERGTIRQAGHDYEGSARAFIEAAGRLEELETYSVSRGAASLVVNDTVQPFRGAPYERTLLHAFAAQAHLGTGNWELAAVEARRIIESLEPGQRGDFPEDGYSRYVAGLCLELVDDPSNAALQYRRAAEAAPGVAIDPATGRLAPAAPDPPDGEAGAAAAAGAPGPRGPEAPPRAGELPAELVCLVLIGRAPTAADTWADAWRGEAAPYAEVYAGHRYLGRSYPLADVTGLAAVTAAKQALQKTAKTAVRLVVKEALAEAAESRTGDEGWGDLVRFVLIGLLEQPDVRRWETLPRWLQAARVPCPAGLDEFRVVFRTPGGAVRAERLVTTPIRRRDGVFVALCRDLPAAGP